MRLRGCGLFLLCHLSQLPSLRVFEGELQLGMGELLVALAQQTDQLRLEDGLEEVVGIVLMEDEEIILPGAVGSPRGLSGGQETLPGLGDP